MGIRSIICFTLFLQLSCFSKKDSEWTVLTAGIPQKLTTSFSQSLLTSYVMKQTHKTIFELNKNGSYFSKLLSSWKRTLDYRNFELCVDKPIPFNKSKQFDVEYLENFLKSNLLHLSVENSNVSVNGQCVTVAFDNSEENFLFQLTLPENAPTVTSVLPNAEDGLGDFYVENYTNEQILLIRKSKQRNVYNSIRFVDVDSLDKIDLNLKNVEDFNQIPSERIPDWVSKEFESTPVTFLATGTLVINIKDQKLRSSLFECLPIDKFLKAIVPKQKEFMRISSLLPLGIEGGSSGEVKQSCMNFNKFSIKEKKKVIIKVWNDVNNDELNQIADKFFLQTGVNLEFRLKEYTSLIKDIFSANYEVVPLIFDTKRELYKPFFEPLLGPKKLISLKLNREEDLYNRLVSSPNNDKQKSIALEIQKLLIDKKVVLPMMQKRKTLYYPQFVEKVIFGDDFLNFPNVADIEL